MMNRFALKQARRMIRENIDESPTVILITRMPLVSDGFGGLVPDPFGTPEEHSYRVRIAHERKVIDAKNPSSAGYSTSLQRFILTEHTADIREGDIFEAVDGKQWKIGPVDPLEKFGGVIGKQAVLYDAAEAT